MANNHNHNQGQNSFWDFFQQHNPRGAGVGVDHAHPHPFFGAGFPFDAPGWFHPGQQAGWGGARNGFGGGPFPWDGPGRGGRRHGRRHRRHGRDSDGEQESDEPEMEDSPETMREDGPPGPPVDGSHPPPPPAFPFHHGRHHHGGPGFFRGRGGCGRRGRGRHGPPTPPSFNGPFDFRPWMSVLAAHPYAQGLRDYMDQARAAGQDGPQAEQDDTFTPPVDIFNTEREYVLHVSLPGAVKEDVGVNWDADRGVLHIAGVVYRPGNEEFLQSLHSGERSVGMFERSIKLPPAEIDEKEEVNGSGISAKMETGILIVTVPKAEKEWTEIHKVDVE